VAASSAPPLAPSLAQVALELFSPHLLDHGGGVIDEVVAGNRFEQFQPHLPVNNPGRRWMRDISTRKCGLIERPGQLVMKFLPVWIS